MSYVTGNTIQVLREKRKLTQKELAEKINVSDKTISKWETCRGLPDISASDGILIPMLESLLHSMKCG